MNEDTQESGRRGRYFRYAVFLLAALVVVSLGFVVLPRNPVAPATPPFTEQARASAYSDALSLRSAGLVLAGGGGAPSNPQAALLDRVVTLLTVQARALMLPSDAAKIPVSAPSSVPPSPAAPPSAAGFAAALQASAALRLKDAETADGGMARLLAGAGTAQLLAAEQVAAAAGVPLAARPAAPVVPSPPSKGSQVPTGQSTASAVPGCATQPTGEAAGAGPALASAAAAERELVYAYQAALVRLDAAAVPAASAFLAQHRALGHEAGLRGRADCAALPAQPAGYVLNKAFLAAPAVALGILEAGTLPVYGDLVALSAGSDRAWAVSALQSAARRTLQWGGSPGPVPGMALAEALLPELPQRPPAASPATTAAGAAAG